MKEFVCIICPNGCNLKVDDNLTVSGNLCKRGETFAKEEIKNPQRTVTTTCKTTYKNVPVVPVKTSGTVKKELVTKVVEEVNKKLIDKPLGIGEIVIENVLDTGINIIMCSNELKEQ